MLRRFYQEHRTIKKEKTMKALFSAIALLSSASAFATTYECEGAKSGNFYDVTPIDVGDEEGEIVVNNGGAPKAFSAHYDQGDKEESFIFGFEEYNEGLVPVLSEIVIKVPSKKNATKTTGTAEYFEHDSNSQSHQLIKESLSCKIVK